MGNLIEILRNVQTLLINNIFLEGLSPRYVDFEYKDMEFYLPNLKELQIVRYGLTYVNTHGTLFSLSRIVKGYKKLELEEKLVNFFLLRAKILESLIIVSKDKHLEIKSKDVVTVSKIVTISAYYHHRDKSSVFPKHTIF
ncbi:hypothetical protein R3W88_005797 [Solanum pinnatisectum]|uniref:HTH LytTR-type domain-containing protein n=1 Tax=Solanum pinnatisectum TaxID=50273 RepID=A0AAV9KDF3_9SOLN|nr:hypothetical protein R3W88_005797 [Solanum pinnatisectum]